MCLPHVLHEQSSYPWISMMRIFVLLLATLYINKKKGDYHCLILHYKDLLWDMRTSFVITATRIIVLISPIKFQTLQVYHRRAVDEDHFSVDGRAVAKSVSPQATKRASVLSR